MAYTASDRAKATGGMHSALYFWYFAVVVAAGLAGGLVFMDADAGPTGIEQFGWQAAGGFAIAAAVLGVPVMVAFALGERILFELMELNAARESE